MNITFEKAHLDHQKVIFKWLAKPHIQEFWDNSQEHKDDIINFMCGNKRTYFYGTMQYWVALMNNRPFGFIVSDDVLTEQEDLPPLHRAHLSKTGHTVTLDFGIGDKEFLGKKLASPTLIAFTEFYKAHIDPKADTFFIDPDESNPKACHVYETAGFEKVGEVNMTTGFFNGGKIHLMTKTI
jgi:RimJ/RimL family protein N-acetyltransferase